MPATAGLSVVDLGITEDELLDEFLLGDEEDLGDEEGPTIEEILGMDVDRLESDDNMPEGRFLRLEAERSAESRPVLETATHLKADLRQEVHTPKATSSSEKVADRAEDPGADFRQNIAFMQETLPKEAMP